MLRVRHVRREETVAALCILFAACFSGGDGLAEDAAVDAATVERMQRDEPTEGGPAVTRDASMQSPAGADVGRDAAAAMDAAAPSGPAADAAADAASVMDAAVVDGFVSDAGAVLDGMTDGMAQDASSSGGDDPFDAASSDGSAFDASQSDASPPDGGPVLDATDEEAGAPPDTPPCVPAVDECELETGWLGDDSCIAPPPPESGFQLHVGPESYEAPAAQYVLQPGEERNQSWNMESPNVADAYVYFIQYRMRAGGHRLSLYARPRPSPSAPESSRLGDSTRAVYDDPPCGRVAPENDGLARFVAPLSRMTIDTHFFNNTDEPLLSEAWINMWYLESGLATEQATPFIALGEIAFAIRPGEHTTIGPSRCTIAAPARLLSLGGYFHANTVRLSVWHRRAGVARLLLEDYDWQNKSMLHFNSLVDNRVPDPQAEVAGGIDGVVDLQPGDVLEWECEVRNRTDQTLRFAEEVLTGEMCILFGTTVGSPLCPLF